MELPLRAMLKAMGKANTDAGGKALRGVAQRWNGGVPPVVHPLSECATGQALTPPVFVEAFLWRQTPPPELLQAFVDVWQEEVEFRNMTELWAFAEASGWLVVRNHIGAIGWFREHQLKLDEGSERGLWFLNHAQHDPTFGERFAACKHHFETFDRFYGWALLQLEPLP